MSEPITETTDFIREIVVRDNATGKYDGRVETRFPPEPNGYLHIGHAKSICLNFGMAAEYGGVTHLRFDDTNPLAEEVEYVESIEEDVRWLGFDWGNRLHHASDYFDRLYEYAVQLVRQGDAYVCDLTEEEIREYRGTVTEPGRESPGRERTVEENLDLLERMRSGEFPDGARTLRARIDMASSNMQMRDPLIYRIRRVSHHQTGDKWNIYPMYDFAHCLSDYIESITHSICTLEFENNRELYDWFLEHLVPEPRPQQIEFARLNLSYTVLSKRRLKELVEKKLVNGWDDPRMPTIVGLRRRGYTPESIRDFCSRIGVAKRDSRVDLAQLEYSIRTDLNLRAPRVMAVLRPLKVVIENYPEGKVEELPAINNPEDESMGSRMLPFSREIYIERTDFMEDPPKKYFRLSPGAEVRLKHAYFIKCTDVIKDADTGEITELRCTYDPATRSGEAQDRKVKGTLHWVSAAHAVDAEVHWYDRLFTSEDPTSDEDFTATLNPDSLEILSDCKVEPSLTASAPGWRYQFLRHGYFCTDSRHPNDDRLVFNRTVGLRDTWAKVSKTIGISFDGEGKTSAFNGRD
jgi:glutaminyl-tRNA synthetase